MQVFNSLSDLAGLVPPPPPAPESDNPASRPRTYDCTGCRFADSHGLVCDVCLRRILNGQAGQRTASLIAACFDGHGITLLRARQPALV
jgi:hypothetical protein